MPHHKMTTQIIPVILCGGSGTRLWPVSRKTFPKQFWPLASARSMLVDTALRAVGPAFGAPIVMANNAHRFIVAEQLVEAGVTDARILLEPVGRNSAPAIAVACLLAARDNPQAILWVMAADAAIQTLPALHQALDTAVDAAHAGWIVAFGVTPATPETGYGYLAQGAALPGIAGAYHLERFVEKPDLAQAQAMLAQGGYSWNSGMFVFRADVMLEELQALAPEVLAAAREALAASVSDLDFIRLAETFAKAPNISIDYAIAEKTRKMAMVPATIGWSDVGSWAALAEVLPSDAQGNVTQGDAVLEACSHCYVRSDGVLTALLGVKDLVVITTQDAVLVAHKDQAQNVKMIVERLKEAGRAEADSHLRHYRPWGFYEGLIKGERFQVKRIVVSPGQRLSLQKHYHRAEHWVVVEGVAMVTRDEERLLLQENESVYLPLGSVHRLENPGKTPLTLIEVQSGTYLGEDDIVRLEDTYGRS